MQIDASKSVLAYLYRQDPWNVTFGLALMSMGTVAMVMVDLALGGVLIVMGMATIERQFVSYLHKRIKRLEELTGHHHDPWEDE